MASVKAKCGQECGFAVEEALDRAEARLADLTSAVKQWRQATESRLRLLDSRNEAAKAMLPADRALCEAIDRVGGS